ncbi:MAG: hypothetical protein ACI37S_00320 [Candidatus Gastranaerophilaceae bacterium]
MKIFNSIVYVIVLLLISLNVTACTYEKIGSLNKNQIANPWTDCKNDFNKAASIAGFSFDLVPYKYDVRAMSDMIEVSFLLNDEKEVVVRKSVKDINEGDISGVYTKYPINDVLNLKKGYKINIRRDVNVIYVMYFRKNGCYYSAYCERGMSVEEVESLYKMITLVESK